MGEAEQHTAQYYCIPPYRWERLNFDLLTRQDHEWEPLPEAALARIRHLIRPASQKLPSYDFYRIELNDPLIVDAAARTDLTSDFYHFLVYIITHEMVHLVRFSSILEDLPQEKCFYESEEHRVQRICRQILTGRSKFRPVLERFCIHQASGCFSDGLADGFWVNVWSGQAEEFRELLPSQVESCNSSSAPA